LTTAGLNALRQNLAQSPPQQGVFGVQQSPNIEVEPPTPKTHSPRRPTPHNKEVQLVKASQKLSKVEEEARPEVEEEHPDDEQFDQPSANLVTLWMDGSGSGSDSGGWLEGV